jgi:uncharacterized protein YjbI with pentapeptide repeats
VVIVVIGVDLQLLFPATMAASVVLVVVMVEEEVPPRLDSRAGGVGADVEGADVEGADVEGADSEGADSEGADSEGADSEGADGSELCWVVCMTGVIVAVVEEDDAEFEEDVELRMLSKVVGVEVVGAEVVGAEVVGAELIGAEVVGAELIGAELIGAEFIGAEFVGPGAVPIIDGCDLSNVTAVAEEEEGGGEDCKVKYC